MKEAKITINNRELTEAQSMTVRVAMVAFLGDLHNEEVSKTLGMIGVGYYQRLTEVLGMIDETPAERSGPDEQLVVQSLEFISELLGKK
jgi:hypothetical protein